MGSARSGTARGRLAVGLVLATLLLSAGAAWLKTRGRPLPPPAPPHFDLLIRGGEVVDGTGREPFRADVGIVGDRIALVGDLAGATADRVLDVPGRYVSPGFINPHSHIDTGLEEDPDVAASLLQGITTEIVGLDGEAPLETGAYLDRLAARGGLGVNVAVLAGHGVIRRAVMGHQARPPSDTELDRMRELARRAMEDGALGMSTGLEYVPGRYSSTEELVALARVVAAYRGVYVSHIRNERDRVLAAVQEALEIGRRAGATVHISHIKVARKPGWPADRDVLESLSRQVAALIETARAGGQPVFADLYPYPVPWFLTRRPFSRAHPAYPLDSLEPALPDFETVGNTITDLARAWGVTPRQAAARLRQTHGDFPVAVHSIDERALRFFLAEPFTVVSVDAPIPGGPWWGGVLHPRAFGTYPRVLGVYVREAGLLSWGTAVRKMSGLTAEIFGLTRRGLVQPGHFADLVVFDPATVRDRATYAEPARPPSGIEYVVVNGQLAVEGGQLARLPGPGGQPGPGVRAGRILRRQGIQDLSPP